MIQVDNLHLSYSGIKVLDDVSFSLLKGQRCGLIGRNGCGKSTLFRLLTKQEVPDTGVVSIPKGYKIGHLQQHIRFTMPTCLDEAALGLKEDDRDSIYKVERILLGLGFSEDQFDVDPKSLSGGYQLRIQLAKVLLSEPDCLLLDEPTNYLDIISIRFLVKFLRKWPKEMILISHDLDFLDATTTHMMTIHRKKCTKIQGKSSDLFALIAEMEEHHEKQRVGLEKKRAHLESFVERFGAKASKAAQAQSRKKALDKMPTLEKLKSLYNLDFSFKQAPFSGKKMLEAQHLSFGYDEGKKLIKEFSLTIENNDRIAIIGKNGYGKSTILKLLSKELTAKEGSCVISPNVKIGYFGQTNIERLHKDHTIEEEIASANRHLSSTEVRGICGLMMFGKDLAEKPISVLSGGEKSRVLLGKIIAEPCNLLFLDEPTHHLDIKSIEALIDAMDSFEGAVIIVTHSEWMLKRLPLSKLVVCHKNQQETFLGNYDEFLDKKGFEEEKEESAPKKEVFKPKKNVSVEPKIIKCEKQIDELQKSVYSLQEQLASIPVKEVSKIQTTLQLIEKKQGELSSLYKTLEELFEQI